MACAIIRGGVNARQRLIVALDFPSLAQALEMAERLMGRVGMLKIGLELLMAEGPWAASRLVGMGVSVFADTKLSDIPNTVAGAAAAIARLGVSMFNVHATAGVEAMRAAREASDKAAVEAGKQRPLVLGVTVLTSLDQDSLAQQGISSTVLEQVVRLARLSEKAGLDGVVASPAEVRAIKEACGADFITVVPGIRPQAVEDDQRRTMTPREAVEAGADYIVIGRPITKAADPVKAVEDIVASMDAG